MMMKAQIASWTIAGLATAGVIARPLGWPEAVWAVSGAVLLVVLGLLPAAQALSAVMQGSDVYLFLAGMMLLSEMGRREGLFDWAAVAAVNHARGSPRRLFLLVYGVGVLMTTFVSNDAAAVVLTPAVMVAVKKAKTQPMPAVFACAFIANAASFVLPISNPANIVLYGSHTPALGDWLRRFAAPSFVSIVVTYLLLLRTQRRALAGTCEHTLPQSPPTASAWIALGGLAATAVVLAVASAAGQSLGLPTALMGLATTLAVMLKRKASPWAAVKDISWGVLALVAGLFVLVESLARTGVIRALSDLLQREARAAETATAAAAAGIVALASNLMNNLPVGLVASSAIAQSHVSQRIVDALLIAVDLGPNLSITGSLATILWLTAIRREGENVSFLDFLKVGAVVMPVSLVATVATRLAL